MKQKAYGVQVFSPTWDLGVRRFMSGEAYKHSRGILISYLPLRLFFPFYSIYM